MTVRALQLKSGRRLTKAPPSTSRTMCADCCRCQSAWLARLASEVELTSNGSFLVEATAVFWCSPDGASVGRPSVGGAVAVHVRS